MTDNSLLTAKEANRISTCKSTEVAQVLDTYGQRHLRRVLKWIKNEASKGNYSLMLYWGNPKSKRFPQWVAVLKELEKLGYIVERPSPYGYRPVEEEPIFIKWSHADYSET